MPQNIDITLLNGSLSQNLFFAKDTFLNSNLLGDNGTLLGPGENVGSQLAAGPDNHGHIQYWYKGGSSQTRDDVSKGDTIDMSS